VVGYTMMVYPQTDGHHPSINRADIE